MAESNKSLTLKLSLTDKPISSIIDIDPITRINLINEKKIINSKDTITTDCSKPKGKTFLINKYKQLAETLNKIVTTKEKKITKPSKNAKTITFDLDDLVYDVSKYENADQSNHIIINNIEDSKLKINISNIINKEIEKSAQRSNTSLNNISSSFKPIPSGNPTPTSFATPADKVINFNASHANKHAKPLGDIGEQPTRKRKVNAGTNMDSKKVSFDLNESAGMEANKGLSFVGDTNKPTMSFGLKRNKDSEEVKKPAFSFGGSTEKKDDGKPVFGFGAAAEKKEEVKPTFGFGSATEKKEEVKPAFNFGATTEKKEEVKPAFNFGATTEKKDDTKPAFNFGSTTEKKEDTKPAFNFGATTEKKDESKPAFTFGAATEKKDDTKPSFGLSADSTKKPESQSAFSFGAATEKKDDSKPAFNFGTSTEKKEDVKPAFNFGSSTEKKDDSKPAFNFGSSTEKKDDVKPAFGLATDTTKNTDTQSAFSFGAPSTASATEKKGETKPAFNFGASTAAKPAATSAFNFGAANDDKKTTSTGLGFGAPAADATAAKPASRFEGFGTSTTVAKPKSRFDPTPVGNAAPASGFNFGASKPPAAASPFGTNTKATKPAVASPFGTNNAAAAASAFGTNNGAAGNAPAASPFGTNNNTPAMPGLSRFDNNTPVNQSNGIAAATNPDVFKPVSGFNFQAPTQPNLLSGFSSSNTSQSPAQLNFNINSKFKSMSPPQQAPSFQPGAMNFSFGGSLPTGNNMNAQPASNNGMSAGSNMSFGGFGGSQQTNSNGAVNGRRIAKLRKR